MRLAACLFVSMAIACGDAAPTQLDLEVVAEASWGIDDYQVRVGDRAALASAQQRLTVLLPDELAGHPAQVQVWGLVDGIQVAYGKAMVIPSKSATVPTQVTLGKVECSTWCEPGAQSCEGDARVECRQGANGCVGWGPSTPCPEATPYCSNGSCDATCTDECAPGATRCQSSATVQTCGEHDSDPCRDWSTPAACPGGTTCDDGACESTTTCDATSCTMPDPPTCLNPTTVRTFSGPGTCGSDGRCDYPHTDSPCATQCIAGECCSAKTCTQMGYECGSGWDGCMGVVTCSTCMGNSGCAMNHCVDDVVFEHYDPDDTEYPECPSSAHKVDECEGNNFNPDAAICVKNAIPAANVRAHGSFDPAPCPPGYHEAAFYYCAFSYHRICIKD